MADKKGPGFLTDLLAGRRIGEITWSPAALAAPESETPCVPDRPTFTGALSLGDIKMDMTVVVHNTRLGTKDRFLLLSDPYHLKILPGESVVLVQELSRKVRDPHHYYLADMGIVPYSDGKWNPHIYTTLEEETPSDPAPV